ncbi:hypothetical protein IG631_22316 [Alternaria alternata]|nr:hypothetical protein IG631_22316 [Alternaria alternata]
MLDAHRPIRQKQSKYIRCGAKRGMAVCFLFYHSWICKTLPHEPLRLMQRGGTVVEVTRLEPDHCCLPFYYLLTASGNTVVKVVITNTGDTTLNLLSTGTLLDDTLPVERVTLYSNSGCKRQDRFSVSQSRVTTLNTSFIRASIEATVLQDRAVFTLSY